MKNKKGSQLIGVLLVGLLIVALTAGGIISWKQGLFTSNQAVGGSSQQIINQVADASKTGQVATAGIYVRDISNNNINTKLAVAVYCLDDSGTMIIDGTSSSTTAEITGKTSIGKTLTCYAFNSTIQTKTPTVVKVDDEYEHIVIDAYRIATAGAVRIQFYTDTFVTGNGTANVTAPASGSGTLSKMRITNNNTDAIFPLGGVYMDVPVSTNITNIEMSGSATLSGFASGASASFEKTSFARAVPARQEISNYVFGIAGSQPLLIEENDYLESGSITVTADADSCDAEPIYVYAYSEGNFRSAVGNTIGFGSESDASTPVVISTDTLGDVFFCL